MKDEMRYFKHPESDQFVKASIPSFIPSALFVPMMILSWRVIPWLITGSGPFVPFSDCFDMCTYCIFITAFLVWHFRNYHSLYHRMHETPFLTMKKEGIIIIREMLPFFAFLARSGTVFISWPDIERVEVEGDKSISFFHKKADWPEKGDLRWVQGKEGLLKTLKTECEDHDIEWVEKVYSPPKVNEFVKASIPTAVLVVVAILLISSISDFSSVGNEREHVRWGNDGKRGWKIIDRDSGETLSGERWIGSIHQLWVHIPGEGTEGGHWEDDLDCDRVVVSVDDDDTDPGVGDEDPTKP